MFVPSTTDAARFLRRSDANNTLAAADTRNAGQRDSGGSEFAARNTIGSSVRHGNMLKAASSVVLKRAVAPVGR